MKVEKYYADHKTMTMKSLIINKLKNSGGAKKRLYRREKGFALALTLVIFAILLLLSSTYIASVAYDAKFSQTRNTETQAIFMARSGIEYYRYLNSPEGGIQKTFVDTNAFSVKIVSINGESFVESTGIVNNIAGVEIAKEVIIAPIGNLKKWRRVY